ncbi:MAG: hypothetical protein LBN07_01920 [Christensenellaceae bacterium]|jgi:hypothetical protein|nr:hypothetical protein [Christensenellaceae bacterium]
MAEIFSKEDDVLSGKEAMKSLMCLVRNYIRHINKPKYSKEAIIKDQFMAAAICANMVNAISLGKKDFSYFGITASQVLEWSTKKNNPFSRAACNVRKDCWRDMFKDWAVNYKRGQSGIESDDICKNIMKFEGNPHINSNLEFKTKWFLKEVCSKEEIKSAKDEGDEGIKTLANTSVIKVLNDLVSVSEQRMEIEGMPKFGLPHIHNKVKESDISVAQWMAGTSKDNTHIKAHKTETPQAHAF